MAREGKTGDGLVGKDTAYAEGAADFGCVVGVGGEVMATKLLRKNPKSDQLLGLDDHSSKVLFPAVAGAFIGNLIVPGIGGVLVGGLLGGTIGASNSKEKKMAKIPVFYSFHFDNDVMRVQQVRNIGSIEGNSPTNPNEWEQLKRTGKSAVENWINENMKYKRCVIVLIGTETHDRPWVKYEIEKAWNDGKALLGIHIHNLKCPRNGTTRKGKSPFDEFKFDDGRKLSSIVSCYDPNPANAYNDIADNIADWINHAISNKKN